MAIYHLNLKSGSRGGGQSAAAKMDYIEREGKYEKGKAEIAHIEHGNMPEFAQNYPRHYWQSADQYERENGRLFTQIEFALPKELNHEQQLELTREFIQSVCGEHHLPYSFAIHKGQYDHSGKRTNSEAKPHVHLIISERANDGILRSAEQWFKRANKKIPSQGGAAKIRAIKSTDWLENQRATWAKLANNALEKAGYEARIDHRSLEAQGITDRLPQSKKGAAQYMEKRGEQTDQMAVFKARLAASEILANLHQENRDIDKKIAIVKAEILRIAKNSFIPQHQEKHTRSHDTLNSLDTLTAFDQLRSLDHSPSLQQLEAKHEKTTNIAKEDTPIKGHISQRQILMALGAKWDVKRKTWYVPKGKDLTLFTDYLPQEKEQKEHEKNTQHDMRDLPEQRHDRRNHDQPERGKNRRENLLHNPTRHDMETSGRTPHSTMQPLRSQQPNHDYRRGLNPEEYRHAQAIAALTTQYSYEQLTMQVEIKSKAYTQAKTLQESAVRQLERLSTEPDTHHKHIADTQAKISALQQGFMGGLRHRKEITELEASIGQAQRLLKEVKEEITQQHANLEHREQSLNRATTELEQYALALQVSGKNYRTKQLLTAPEVIRQQWQQLEQRFDRQHIKPLETLTHERRLLAEFRQFTQQQKFSQVSKQHIQNKGKNSWER